MPCRPLGTSLAISEAMNATRMVSQISIASDPAQINDAAPGGSLNSTGRGQDFAATLSNVGAKSARRQAAGIEGQSEHRGARRGGAQGRGNQDRGSEQRSCARRGRIRRRRHRSCSRHRRNGCRRQGGRRHFGYARSSGVEPGRRAQFRIFRARIRLWPAGRGGSRRRADSGRCGRNRQSIRGEGRQGNSGGCRRPSSKSARRCCGNGDRIGGTDGFCGKHDNLTCSRQQRRHRFDLGVR